MNNVNRVVICGIGLMGGSLAKALRPHVKTIVAVDSNDDVLAQVRAAGAADHCYNTIEQANIQRDDLLILAVPVRTIAQTVAALPAVVPGGCMVLDLGSTKLEICQAMDALPPQFEAMGGHPMCGIERSGFAVSFAEMYVKQAFILIPTARTTTRIFQAAEALVAAIGAIAIEVAADRHDQMLGLISHMPHLVSMILMNTAHEWADGDETVWYVSASSFQDMSRLSGSDPRMWRDIFLTNREAVLEHLHYYRAHLDNVIMMLQSAEGETLQAWLGDTQTRHTDYQATKRRFEQGLVHERQVSDES